MCPGEHTPNWAKKVTMVRPRVLICLNRTYMASLCVTLTYLDLLATQWVALPGFGLVENIQILMDYSKVQPNPISGGFFGGVYQVYTGFLSGQTCATPYFANRPNVTPLNIPVLL
jgi:hypothetical protein